MKWWWRKLTARWRAFRDSDPIGYVLDGCGSERVSGVSLLVSTEQIMTAVEEDRK